MSQAVTCTVKVVISRKRCKRDTLLLQTTNTNWWYGLSDSGNADDLEWSSRSFTHCKPFQMQFFVQLCSSCQGFSWERVAWSLCDSSASCSIYFQENFLSRLERGRGLVLPLPQVCQCLF